jgi:hypothetical protein
MATSPPRKKMSQASLVNLQKGRKSKSPRSKVTKKHLRRHEKYEDKKCEDLSREHVQRAFDGMTEEHKMLALQGVDERTLSSYDIREPSSSSKKSKKNVGTDSDHDDNNDNNERAVKGAYRIDMKQDFRKYGMVWRESKSQLTRPKRKVSSYLTSTSKIGMTAINAETDEDTDEGSSNDDVEGSEWGEEN